VKPELAKITSFSQNKDHHRLPLTSPTRNMTKSAPTILTLTPTFTVFDEAKFRAIADKIIESTKRNDGIVFYGLAQKGNVIKVLEAYTSGSHIQEHITSNKDLVAELIHPDVSKLEESYVSGPEDEVQKAMEVLAPFGTQTFTILPDLSYWNSSWSIHDPKEGRKSMSEVTVHALFTVHDWDKVLPLMHQSMERTKQNGCIFYSFLKSDDGSKLRVRETWPDPATLDAHMHGPNGIGHILGEALQTGLVAFDSLYVTAPAEQLDDAKKIFEAFNAEGFEVSNAFSCLVEAAQSG
jgi:quinol monooxygenase YgiN